MFCHPGEERPRILLRELRRRKQPKRSDSLPCLQISPGNRQLYVCRSCNFYNHVCSLCPWCFSPCEPAAFVSIVRRRLSSPSLLSEAQKMQLRAIERGAQMPLISHPSDAPPHLPGGVFSSQTGSDNARRRHRNVALYSATDVVTTTTTDKILQPFLDQIAAAQQENRERQHNSPGPEATTSPSPSLRSTRRPTNQASRTQPPHTSTSPRTPTTTRTRMVQRDVDLTVNTSEPRTPSEPAQPPCHSPSPTPGLRRKRRMSVLRQRSSCSLRRRATTSSVGTCRRDSSTTSSPSSPRSKAVTSVTSVASTPTPPRSQTKARTSASVRFSPPPAAASIGRKSDDDLIPLGHPQRPLYTAIRKNMSRPSSPAPSAASFGDVPLHHHTMHAFVYAERGTRSLDIDPPLRFGSLTRAVAARAPHYAQPNGSLSGARAPSPAAGFPLFPSAGAGVGAGCSVSGATELRMDLARSRSADGVPSDFAFREVRPASGMKSRVKSFGRTLKGLLRGVM